VFKTKALAAVRDGYTMAEVGRALGLHDSVVRKWVLRNGGAPARDQSTQLQTIRNTINIQPDEMHKGGSGRRIYAPALRQRILDFMQREHTPGATMERALGLSRGMLTRWMFEQRTGKPYDKRKRTTRAKKS
jgi:transposase-like protein